MPDFRYNKTAAEFDDDLVSSALSSEPEASTSSSGPAPSRHDNGDAFAQIAAMGEAKTSSPDAHVILLRHQLQVEQQKRSSADQNIITGFLSATKGD